MKPKAEEVAALANEHHRSAQGPFGDFCREVGVLDIEELHAVRKALDLENEENLAWAALTFLGKRMITLFIEEVVLAAAGRDGKMLGYLVKYFPHRVLANMLVGELKPMAEDADSFTREQRAAMYGCMAVAGSISFAGNADNWQIYLSYIE